MDIEKKEIHIVPPQRMQTAGMFALAMLPFPPSSNITTSAAG